MLTLVLADCEVKITPQGIEEEGARLDIIHFSLLLTQDSGIAEERELRTLVHTRGGKVLQFDSDVKIPDSIEKFKKMMLNAAEGNQPQGIRVLEKGLMKTLEDEVGKRIVMTPKGEMKDPSELFSRSEDYVVVIGGFSKGDFKSPIYEWAEKEVSISDRMMKPWSVTAETLAGYRYCSLE